MPPGAKTRRREARFALPIPVRVHGFEANGDVWEEAVAVEDVCSEGVSFVLEREVEVGRVLRLDVALPRTLRAFDVQRPTYRVYAVARHVTLTSSGYRVGTLFLGRDPPRGFEAHPDGRFLLPDDVPPEPRSVSGDPSDRPAELLGSRTAERLAVLVNLHVQHADAKGAILQEELTVSDNLSEGGAELRTSLDLAPGDVIQVREVDGPFDCRAEVCEASMGSDGIRRLHVRFLDGQQPTHLIRRR